MVSDRFELEMDSTGVAGSGLADLDRQIRSHEAYDDGKSYLGRAISYVWGEDEKSLSRLQDLKRQAESAQSAGDQGALTKVENQIAQQINADRKAVALQGEVNHYGAGFLKTGALFLRGGVPLAATIAIHALDQANPSDNWKNQLTDISLGGATGGLMKGAFHLLGTRDVSIAARGVGLGITSRALDFGLTRATYENNAGEFSLGHGLSKTVQGSLDRTALATDVFVFAGAHGLLKGAGRLTGGAIERSPLLNTMLTGTTFGITSGATGEIARQHSAGESFDLVKVAQRAALQGAVDTFAAAPGGLQARAARMQLDRQIAEQRLLSGLDGQSSLGSLPAREFVVTKGQEILSSFEARDSSAAWLKVREVLSRGADGRAELGIERTLVLQHRENGQTALPEAAKAADLIATCNPESLAPALRAKHVFGAGEGPVYLSKTANGESLELSVGQRPDAGRGYDQVLQLGFSREVTQAMSKAERGDKHAKEVGMDGIGKLTARPGDKDKVIFTAGLGGCTAVVLLVERPDGTRTAVMSHEIAYNAVSQFEKVQKTASTIPGLFDPGTKKSALVLTAEAFDGEPFSNRMRSIRGVSGDPAGEAHLVESLKSALGVTSVKSLTYNATNFYSRPVDDGVLLLNLRAGRPATFKTWFSGETPFDFSPPKNDNAGTAPAKDAPQVMPSEQKLAG